ncbi:unnamed protein product, partial [Ectocarpus fasciculatus]
YVLPLLTFHIGHVLVDLLEQVFHSMVAAYGDIRRDSLIVLDVASQAERKALQARLLSLIYEDSPFSVLQLLSDVPIITYDTYTSFCGDDKLILFEDLHFGLDISSSFINAGVDYHPALATTTDFGSPLKEMANKYQRFQAAVAKYVRGDNIRDPSYSGLQGRRLQVLVVKRARSRIILNLVEIVEYIREKFTADVQVLSLENLSFSAQLKALNNADIVVQTAGTSVHNLLFMSQRPLALVLIMQYGWCDWAWMYANQAVLLGISAHVHCSEGADSAENMDSTSFSLESWLEGPAMYKNMNISIDLSMFAAGIDIAVNRAHQSQSSRRILPQYEDDNFDGRDNLFELFIPRISVEETANNGWTVKVFLEIGLDRVASGAKHNLFASFPHLSACIDVVDVSDASRESDIYHPGIAMCAEVYRLNYASWISLTTYSPKIVVRGWLQASPSGGVIKSSDVYVYVNTRLPDEGGFNLIHCMLPSCEELTKPINLRCINDRTTGASGEFLYGPNGENAENKQMSIHRRLQRMIVGYCRARGYSIGECVSYCDFASREVLISFAVANAGLPTRQVLPSPKRPFFFFHIEKCAGTSLRHVLAGTSELLGLDYFIPCEGFVSCKTFSIGESLFSLKEPIDSSVLDRRADLSNVSVVGGHFAFHEWTKLPAWDKNSFIPACVVTLRHPVSRVISYYYQRCYNASSCPGYHRRINELTETELASLLLSLRGTMQIDNSTIAIIDEGISNAACRSMLGERTSTGYHLNISNPVLLSPRDLTINDVNTARRNLEQCIVGLQEDWTRTTKIFEFWFPWLNFSLDDGVKKMQLYRDLETLETLSSPLRHLIEDANQCDMALYEHAKFLYEKQLAVLSGHV